MDLEPGEFRCQPGEFRNQSPADFRGGPPGMPSIRTSRAVVYNLNPRVFPGWQSILAETDAAEPQACPRPTHPCSRGGTTGRPRHMP